MPELLLELLSEEIPARMQARAADDLQRLVCDRLGAAGLSFSGSTALVSPRRLVLFVDGLPEQQPDTTEEKKGPKVGAPERAIEGFLRSNGLTSIEQAEVRDSAKGQFYFVARHLPGRPARQVLAETLEAAILDFVWPKSMRWGRHRFRWVRPLQHILAIFGGAPLEGRVDLGDHALPFESHTFGHRFLAPQAFEVGSFADYRAKLGAAKVVVDQAERRRRIAEQGARLAAEAGLSLREDPALLDEVTGLVEWPEVLMGTIDEDFMELPHEVLTTAMRAHQKYFALLDPEGGLANRFLLAANMEAPPDSSIRANIVSGNQRVLRARLADARFFWDQDRKHPLQGRVGALGEMVFHARLGTLEEKVERITTLAAEIAHRIPEADVERVRTAARLCKADLTSGMVSEFPELQGVMGRYYALHEGEHEEVARAIAEHYAPLGPNDACPSAPVSVAVALADKLDTLVGFWLIDEKPTGSKDPYALRRAALGVIRLIVENGLRLPLSPAIATARSAFQNVEGAEVTESLLAFFADRLKVALRDRGVRHDLIASVFALTGEDDLVRLLERVAALERFLESDDGANLLVAFRRAANIVRIESKKDGCGYDGEIVVPALERDEEVALFSALEQTAGRAGDCLEREDFAGAMTTLASLRPPVDAFFDHVTVNTDNSRLRENRLKLLSRIGATLGQVADFSMIEG